jgi:hypothetical protein
VGNVNCFLRERDSFVISTDPSLLDADAVFGLLAQAQWWTGLTQESLERALRNSLCLLWVSLLSMAATSQTQISGQNVNDVVNPMLYTGSDIGAKINSAIAASSLSTGCTIAIPPGTYNLTTQINVSGKNIHLIGTGVILVSTSGNAMVSVGGDQNSIEGITFNLNGVANYGVTVTGSNTTIQGNKFIGAGAYGIVASYARSGLAILNNNFGSDTNGRAPGPMTIQFTSHFRVIGNHLFNTSNFGIPVLASSHGVISDNEFHQPAFTQTVIAVKGQTTFTVTLPSYTIRLGTHVNGVTTAMRSATNTHGNTWTVILVTAPSPGARVTFMGWQALENIQVNSQSFDISITGNSMDGTGDSGIDVVSDYHATTLGTATATSNQTLFDFTVATGSVTFFTGVEINGKMLSGSEVLNGGPVNTSGNNWTVTLAAPLPVGTTVSFVNFAIAANVPADYPGQVVIKGNTVKRAAATGIGIEIGAPNIIVSSNVIEDCAQSTTDSSYSSGMFVSNSLGTSIKNNTITNTLRVPSMLKGISLLYTIPDNGNMDKHVKVGGNVFHGSFQDELFIPVPSPQSRQSGIDVDGVTIPYPESVNTDNTWTQVPNNTNHFTYATNGISLVRDTADKMSGVASIGYPGNRGNSGFFVDIVPASARLFGSHSILKVSWWAKLTNGMWGVQLWSHAGGIHGRFAVQEIDISGAGWRPYSVYISTMGLDLKSGVFLRIVGPGTGNIQKITFAYTPF